MTNKTDDKLRELAKALSRNRKALRDNEAEMHQLRLDSDDSYFDLKPFRHKYLAGEGEDEYGRQPKVIWRGWLHAVDTVSAKQGIEPDEECGYRQTATLMDDKKKIKTQGARIINRIRTIGDQLLRAEP